MGLAAAAHTLGLILIYSAVYTILLNLIGIGISLFRPTSEVPKYLAIWSACITVLSGLLTITSAVCGAFFFLLPSAALAFLNLQIWRNCYREPAKSSEIGLEPKQGATWIVGCVILLNLFLSCGAMHPVMYLASHITHGRPPSDVKRSDVVKGMTMDEIRAMYGEPHQKGELNNGIRWYYHNGTISGEVIAIDFDANQRVVETWQLD